jgi:thioredoxin-dependent adenylylsulfate APS reductase
VSSDPHSADPVAADETLEVMAQRLARAEPAQVVAEALVRYGQDCAIAFSGAEDVVLLEYARRTKRPYRVFCLDTGRLHPETYRFLERAQEVFQVAIEYCFPEARAVERLVRAKGLYSFLRDGHQECCGIRKVEPLRRQLSTLRAWITGQRKDQSPTRSQLPLVQRDASFQGAGGAPLAKFNPLAETSREDVWLTIRGLELPFNELHQRGFVSIGCEPCTRPILPSQHEREGRWWWEESTRKECGLHAGNLPTPPEPGARMGG